MISRRELCSSLLCATGFSVQPRKVVAAARPFCRFSLTSGWSNTGPREYVTHQARPDDPSGIPQAIASIRRALSVTARIDVFIAEQEDNAFATVAGGRKIIVVDVGFLEKLNQLADTEWAAIQVLAHELGHHIAGFVEDSHRGELNADYWSGQALRRLGAARTAATAGILTVGTETDTSSHPSRSRRAAIISRGWDDAARGKIDYSFCEACK